MFVPITKIVTGLLVVLILESFYILYNIFYSFLYYTVGKSQEERVNEYGQLVKGNELTDLTKDKALELMNK